MDTPENIGGSYRDPDGFVFRAGGQLFRQIRHSYTSAYRHLLNSGLYRQLTEKGLLIPHTETTHPSVDPNGWLVIQPQEIPFISYSYEWCFSQLKDAALLTLKIQQEALACGMTLKDASAYNVQFLNGNPIFIDTLSFDFYEEGQPWAPYKQFCEHFLVPMALMARTHIQLHSLLLSNPDGVPLALGSKLLPWSTYFNFGLLLHVHLHARAQAKYASPDFAAGQNKKPMPKNALLQLLQSLEATVKGLTWQPDQTVWADYYQHTNYQDQAMRHKEQLVQNLLAECSAKTVWDLGANTGRFSRIAEALGSHVLALDFDIGATEIHYLENKQRPQTQILPLVQDAVQPSPGLGWRNRERTTLLERGRPDAVLALALVHHLAIGRNIPLPEISGYFADMTQQLIIEFVPKDDSQVQRLLAHRKDVFPDYTQEAFEAAFSTHFALQKKIELEGTARTLYLFSRHAH